MILSNQLNQPIVRKHLLIVALGVFFGLLLYNYFGVSINPDENSRTFSESLLSAFGGILVSYTTYLISIKLDKLLPWKTMLTTRFLSGILLLFFVSFVLVYGLVFCYNQFMQVEAIDAEIRSSNSIKLAIILFISILVYNIIYFALYSYYSYSKLQIESVKYERKQFDLQLKALKSQLNSHFLFNNLNTISSLAFKNATEAENYIRGLAKIYDYTLNSYHEKLVSIQDELEVAKAYLILLQTRFGKAFNFTINITDNSKKLHIPPLTLQMLIENAAKHNQVSEAHPLNVSIVEKDQQIVVSNNITLPPNKVSSFNIGLKNINERFKLLQNEEITITKNGNYNVAVPIIKYDE